MDCKVCENHRYLVMRRTADNRLAVERCDECSVDTLTDEQAAVLARQDGINCEAAYPCYVTE